MTQNVRKYHACESWRGILKQLFLTRWLTEEKIVFIEWSSKIDIFSGNIDINANQNNQYIVRTTSRTIDAVMIGLYPYFLIQWCFAGFILDGVYGAQRPVCPFNEKFSPHCLWILMECPDTWKCALQRKIKKSNQVSY